MTTTTSNTASRPSPIAATLAAMHARVRIGDLVSTEHRAGNHFRRNTFRVDTIAPHTVSGVRVAKTGETVFRNGDPVRGSSPLWLLVDVRPGPQTWADALAEDAAR